MAYRVGVDIGGTFTDLAWLDPDEGALHVEKALTTPQSPEAGVLQVLHRAIVQGLPATAVGALCHGTTLATNAIIERKGASTALITSVGHEDVLEIGRERRYDPFSLNIERAEPLVPRRWSVGVNQRTLASGESSIPLDVGDLREKVARLYEEGVRSVAVCFLHSYIDGKDESRAAEVIRAHWPEIDVSISSGVAPQIGEYERASTNVVNAYVQPLMRSYLARLERGVHEIGLGLDLLIMQSFGGLITSRQASAQAVRLIESGPAAGVIAASHQAKRLGLRKCVAFDMGGTTAKIAFIDDFEPLTTTRSEVARRFWHLEGSGYPVLTPMIDLIEIGAGGGSIARRSTTGLLEVGPESAGADPGPACYRRGGRRPTVTDADVVLGYVDARTFLGGEMELDERAAEEAVQTLAVARTNSAAHVAMGIRDVADEVMANTLRLAALQHGRDLGEYTMIAFGGAGPVHAFDVATRAGIRSVVYPRGVGVMSAIGLALAPLEFEVSRGMFRPLGELDDVVLRQALSVLGSEARGLLHEAGVRAALCRVRYRLSLSYEGQLAEVMVTISEAELGELSAQRIVSLFERDYEARYGQVFQSLRLNIVVLHALAGEDRQQVAFPPLQTVGERSARNRERDLWLTSRPEKPARCAVLDRYALPSGAEIVGPAIVEERESSVFVGERSRMHVDLEGNLHTEMM